MSRMAEATRNQNGGIRKNIVVVTDLEPASASPHVQMEENVWDEDDDASNPFLTATEQHSISNENCLEPDNASQAGSLLSTPIHKRSDEFDSTADLIINEESPIDDSEFNIPAVDYEPTLESVLNDLDGESLYDEELSSPPPGFGFQHPGDESQKPQLGNFPDGSDTISIISKESSGNQSRSSSKSWKPKSNANNFKKPNSILRHVVLKSISSQLNAAAEKINAGTPTAICLGSLVAIGTSHGFVLVFDVLQVLKWRLGEANLREAGGSVSSLTINPIGSRLLVGYAKGLILMYDLGKGKLIRTIADAHAVATAVLTLRFTDFPDLALCGDSGGSVFELNFKRTIGIRSCDPRCIFSGSRGEVCTFEPLLLASFPENPLSKFVLIAFATLSKIIVVMIRPKLKVLFTHSLPCDPTTLPLVSWQMVIIQTTLNEKIVDPVLSFARQNVITFYQVTLDTRNTIRFLPLRTMTLGYSLLNMHWLNARTLALVDVKEKLRILDVRSQEELESIDLSGTRLVYASSHYKGLATGGNVSKAFALAGERACYNSILCHSNFQIVVLGTKSVHALTMRLWHERLDYLVRQHYYIDAIQLGYELYLSKAKAVVGLEGSKNSKRLIVRDKILNILDRFVDRIPQQNFMDDLGTAHVKYHEVISTCINYYVLLDNVEPIFDKLYDFCVENPFTKSAYLESLEPFILNDQLRQIPPVIVKDFVTHYDEIGNYKALEACIVHVDVAALDIHQTMKLCWTHGLYDAIIYIYNQAMNDYVTPLEELMTELNSAISAEAQLTDSQVILGNKLLVYVSCCLAGRAYPYGNISSNLVEKVQTNIFQLITSLHSRDSIESEKGFPYLRTFLHFDTREFLNVLSLSFEEPIFKSELGKRQKQRIVDILLNVMVEQGNFTPTQVGILFTFLARQMAKPESNLFVSKLLFEQVLEHLTSANEIARIDERQQALMELLLAGGLQHFDPEKLLQKCLKAKFYRVCEMLYERKNDYSQIIDCYLLDEARKQQVFSFLHKIFCLMPKKKEMFQTRVMEHLEELIEIDNKKCAQVVYLHLGNLIPELVRSLDSKPSKQYSFLQGVFFTREENQNNIQVDITTTEKYIGLMCQFNPQLVYPFLQSIESYRFEQALEVCAKYKLVEAMGYLLEKEGRINEAFELMMDQFKSKLTQVYTEIEDSGATIVLSSITWNQLQAIFLVMIQFSQRNSPKLLPNDKEKLWLPLLQLLIAAHNKYQDKVDISAAFNDMNKHLLGSMMGHVSLPTIVEVVLNNPSYQTATFGEIRELVTGMLETCTYEEIMVDLVKKITQSDVHEKMNEKLKHVRQGVPCKNSVCTVCDSNIVNYSSDEEEIVVFLCGHSYHLNCCLKKDMKSCPQCTPPSVVPQVTSVEELDTGFHIPRFRTTSFTLNEENDVEGSGGFISHAEFGLKLEVPFKVNLKEF